MDWASSEWKQNLAPLVIQKINVLEEKLKSSKKRQQKQLQCDCLELALEKEKRKVEKEKQQTIEVQRELQSLAEACKDYENKQQKLQSEIHNRDSRIGSLEGLLTQAKKDNCRLQQLENDFKDLRGIRETAIIEREKKRQSLTLDQNNAQEQKSRMFSDSVNENSGINIFDDKENKKILRENDVHQSLMNKIAEQDRTIEELKTKLSLMDNHEIIKESSHILAKTPGRTKFETVVDASPVIKARNNLNVWDSFASTPAKENKDTILRHHSDSIALGSGDEKLVALQTRLKQLCQELDCQRHNFEASKKFHRAKVQGKRNCIKG
ncbi:CENP-F_N domain-containing protein [Caerostris extrusa]|uniref:CENP-F_N domain-containing protein n=1 Tax=Caerostris extrusa TaxID=172846 RepID=A0AAV4P6I9_CAEEX|nr:CENP-F_N domain-containing protein [Caerostris extrusa]